MKNYISLVFISILLFSCSNKKVEQYVLNNDSINILIDRAINQGDYKAYNTVHSYYNLDGNTEPFLYNSMIMAHKYNLPAAYYDVYWTLANPITGETINDLDLKTRYLALYYLLKSYELGYTNAKYNIQDIFGKKTPLPKSGSYLIKMSEIKE